MPNGRPSLARVERIVSVGNTVWLRVRRLKYHAAVYAATTCSVVQLDDDAVAAEVLPVGVVAAAVLLTHACVDIVSPAAHTAAVAAAAAAGGGAVELPCVWRALLRRPLTRSRANSCKRCVQLAPLGIAVYGVAPLGGLMDTDSARGRPQAFLEANPWARRGADAAPG